MLGSTFDSHSARTRPDGTCAGALPTASHGPAPAAKSGSERLLVLRGRATVKTPYYRDSVGSKGLLDLM